MKIVRRILIDLHLINEWSLMDIKTMEVLYVRI